MKLVGGENSPRSPREFLLLDYLMEHPQHQVFSSERWSTFSKAFQVVVYLDDILLEKITSVILEIGDDTEMTW